MTETQLRFVRAILERVPVDRVAELYVFPPMKQGIHESGIAVVAAVRAEVAEAAEATAADAEAAGGAAAASGDGAAAEALVEAACDSTEDASRDASDGLLASDDADGDPAAAPGEAAAAPALHPERHTVYTARYRLTIKGPERGRWELNVVDEADAPLLTVEMVVRGVQRRAGDGAEPERIDANALRELLHGAAAAS